MKTPEEWAEIYFSNRIKFLPDLIKEVQDEVKVELTEAVKKAIESKFLK